MLYFYMIITIISSQIISFQFTHPIQNWLIVYLRAVLEIEPVTIPVCPAGTISVGEDCLQIVGGIIPGVPITFDEIDLVRMSSAVDISINH